jgi:hypothetical protein
MGFSFYQQPLVSGDLIEGTITPKLMERVQPGFINERREQAGSLPTVADFASAIEMAMCTIRFTIPELKIQQRLALNQKFAGGSNNTIRDDLSSEATRKIKNQIIPFLSTIHYSLI